MHRAPRDATAPPRHRATPPRHSPLATRHLPLATRHSPLATHHSPLTTHHSPLATRHSPLATHGSPLTTPHGSLLAPYCRLPHYLLGQDDLARAPPHLAPATQLQERRAGPPLATVVFLSAHRAARAAHRTGGGGCRAAVGATRGASRVTAATLVPPSANPTLVRFIKSLRRVS